LKIGGVWSPESCQSHEKVVIIVPYRNRTDQLMAFLRYMHWFLQRQLVHYRIVIMQQTGRALFNRGMLMNVGFSEIKQLQHVDCVIFHDIDLLPENDRILYRCENMPKHMSAAVSSFHYKLPYSNMFGGVEAFKVAQFHTINGFSNSYFGWGGEDDDLYKRVYLHRLEILRDDQTLARYYMMTHADQPKNPKRFDLLKKSTSRFETDGLNSLVYKCLYIEERPFFTLILVDLDEMFQVRLFFYLFFFSKLTLAH
ncbi:hypothetical protein HELRODRAFT_72896, partial [Helobdella robusta]|uniref:Galactosyltransferase N-terminal domain-containing protein n=1 Tax=Helobdella robusta TaxID=6412 RepID=T1G169_HELRO